MTIDTAEIAGLVATQPSLFAPEGSDGPLVEPGVVAAARAFSASGSPKHTGRTATRDEERCVAAFALLASGVSRRKIAKRLTMGRHTLDAIEAEFERGGKLAPLKERVRRQLELLVSDAAAETRDALAADSKDVESAAWLKATATALGIGFDKHALATGGPTEIVEQRGPDPRAAVASWWAKVTEAEVVTDSDSVAMTLPSNTLQDSVTDLATPSAGSADPGAPGSAAAGPPGGGLPNAGGVPSDDHSTEFPNLSQRAQP